MPLILLSPLIIFFLLLMPLCWDIFTMIFIAAIFFDCHAFFFLWYFSFSFFHGYFGWYLISPLLFHCYYAIISILRRLLSHCWCCFFSYDAAAFHAAIIIFRQILRFRHFRHWYFSIFSLLPLSLFSFFAADISTLPISIRQLPSFAIRYFFVIYFLLICQLSLLIAIADYTPLLIYLFSPLMPRFRRWCHFLFAADDDAFTDATTTPPSTHKSRCQVCSKAVA